MPTWFPRALRLTIGYVLGTLALLWFFNQARDLLGLALLAALFSLALESAQYSKTSGYTWFACMIRRAELEQCM